MLSYPKLHTGIPTIDQTWEKLIYTLQQFVQGHPVTVAAGAEIGDVVYMGAGVRQAVPAIATSSAAADWAGVMGEPVAAGARGVMQTSDVQLVHFEAALALAGGQPVYVSPNTAGRATNVAPVGIGQFVSRIGIITDASAYAPGNLYAKVLIPRCCVPSPVDQG